MDKDVLARVVEFERKLQGRLEEERREAALWLDDFRATLRSAIEGRARQLSEASVQEAERATEDAMREAEAEVQRARERAARIEALPDDVLAAMMLESVREAALGGKR